MSDQFTGRWLVTEYVHDDSGTFLGTVQQTRTLTELANGRVRVAQTCVVSPSLTKHAMGAFAGEWVFEMSREDNLRHYHGVDVVGMGRTLDAQTIVGMGRWTRFGHDFVSFGALVTPQRQLTGGVFYDNDPQTGLVARIVGVAVAETHATTDKWASLPIGFSPHTTSLTWRGTWTHYAVDGTVRAQATLERRYHDAHAYEDAFLTTPERRYTLRWQSLTGNAYALLCEQAGQSAPCGMAYAYDCFARVCLEGDDGGTRYEMLDSETRCLLGIVYRQDSGYEVYRLFPYES
jgi:hypothetical protein